MGVRLPPLSKRIFAQHTPDETDRGDHQKQNHGNDDPRHHESHDDLEGHP